MASASHSKNLDLSMMASLTRIGALDRHAEWPRSHRLTSSPSSRQRELKHWFHIPCLVRPHNRPPWASTIDRLIDSRLAHALGLRRIKGVEDPFCLLWIKADASVSGRNRRAHPISARLDRELSWPILDRAPASVPLMSRFRMTCCNCTRSPGTSREV